MEKHINIIKYTVADLTLIAIRCENPEELNNMKDYFYDVVQEDPSFYKNHEISTIFTVLDAKLAHFKRKGLC